MFGPARSSRMFPSSFKQESPYFLPLESGGLSLPSCLTKHGSGDILWFLMLGYKARRGPALVSPLGLCGFGALCTTRERLPAPTTQRERETETESVRGAPTSPARRWLSLQSSRRFQSQSAYSFRGMSKNHPAEPRMIPWLLFTLLSFGVVCCATADN